MLKKNITKILTVIIFAFLILSSIYTPLYAAAVLPYGMTNASISVGSGSTLASGTTQVGFGGLRWYVVGFNGTGVNKGDGYITLLSKTATGTSVFSDTSDSTWNDYSGSKLQTAVNSLLPSFDIREQNAMVGLTLDGVDGVQPADQKVWAPSYSDASIISGDVRKLDNPWWIRSVCGYGNPIYIGVDGTIYSNYGALNTVAESVRPGTAVNLSNVLYAAPISGVKDSAVGLMNPVNFSSEIKFTLYDNIDLGLSIPGAPVSLVKNWGDNITLNFNGASTGADKYVSCVLVSQSDNLVKYYSKLSMASDGTISIPVSAGIQAGNYTLLIYNEQICPGDRSDYASSPVSVNLTVTGSTNTAPALRPGVPSTAAASVSVGSPYAVDLSTIFYDPDGNALSYRVYVNGSGSAISADKNYSFTPTAAGTTTLRFTAYDGAAESPSYTVTLTATNVLASIITVTAENGATSIGRNAQLQLYYNVLPSNATNQAVTWTVEFSGGGYYPTGEVDFGNMLRTSNVTSDGTVTVCATAQDGSGVYGELVLNILSNIVTGISVSAASEDLVINDTTQMSAAVSPSNANQSVTWSIPQGSDIASVSASGLLSLTGSGTVVVRATANDGSCIYGEKTLTVKDVQHAPSAPTLLSKTAVSVTLNSAAGEEFSSDGLTWQSGTVFNGLTPNTSYNFYARMAQTLTLQASPSSAALPVKTDKAVLDGSVTIDGTLEYGANISANTSGLTAVPICSLGSLSYHWTRDGADIAGAVGSAYSLGAADIGKVINVTVTSDNCDGSISSANASLTSKADPDYTVPTGLTAVYGDTLADVGLPAGFSWDDPLTVSVGEPGTNSFTATYMPSDTACYNIVTGISVTVTVYKILPQITAVPAAQAITYGQTLSDSVLSGGTASVDGSFSWTDGTAEPAVSDSGTTEYSVTFTPTDAVHYYTNTVTVKLTVNKAATSVNSIPSASAIIYGQMLSDSVLSGGSGSVEGSFAWTDGTVKPAVSDSNTTEYSVTFTPDSGNYAASVATVKLTVSKATPVIITVPTASALTYGQTLSDSVLSGWSADISGSFSWDDGSVQPAVSDSGTTEYPVTFMPDDAGNYNTTAAAVKLTVNKATPSVTIMPTASAITYGQALSDSLLTGGTAGVDGSFAWTDGTAEPEVADSDSTAYSVTFTPTDTGNYNSAATTVMLTVNKAATSVTAVPSASAIIYGQTLSDSVLSGGTGSVEGSFAWTDGTAKPAVSDSDTTEYSVTFTPDSGNYAASVATVKLTVSKATPVITTVPTASAITYGQTLSKSKLTGGVVDADGSFAWTDGTIKPEVSDSNTTEYSVMFTPDDTDNYYTASTTVMIEVNKIVPMILPPVFFINNAAQVAVNGIPEIVGTYSTVADINGRTTASITVDTGMLAELLETEENGMTLTIPISGDPDAAEGIFAGSAIQMLRDKEATVVLHTERASYIISASEINIEGILKQFGTNVSPSDISVKIEIAASPDETVRIVENAAENGGFSIIIPPVDFSVSCSYHGTVVDIDSFGGYVERLIRIPDGVDPGSISTAVIVKPDESVIQVPTQIVVINGENYIKVSSLTNSTYAVITNKVEFSDLKNHSAEDIINDMGSRLIVSGIGENTFAPDKNMTRAEFAAITVKALGLAPGVYDGRYKDVSAADWYSGYIETASEYGIINGYGNGAFGPGDTITHEQAMTMIARAMKLTGLTAALDDDSIDKIINACADGTSVSAYAKESIAKCIYLGIVSMPDGKITPKEYITRAEVAVMISELLQKSGLI